VPKGGTLNAQSGRTMICVVAEQQNDVENYNTILTQIKTKVTKTIT
jgi:hypothetical protein